jgi:hypothetical protein
MGSLDWEVSLLTDRTASIHVRSDRRSTENYRLMHMGDRVEMVVTPITEGPTVREAMAEGEFADELEESVTHRFLEASAASFRAVRIVPIP